MWVFDLDGTLVNTQESVRQAYLKAGITMPNDAWGTPWFDWCPRNVHELKNLHYPEMLNRYATTLPLFDVAVGTNAPVITGASANAVTAVKRRFCSNLNVQAFGLTRIQKAEWLTRHWRQGSNIYVDDDQVTRQVIEERTRWLALSPELALAELIH